MQARGSLCCGGGGAAYLRVILYAQPLLKCTRVTFSRSDVREFNSNVSRCARVRAINRFPFRRIKHSHKVQSTMLMIMRDIVVSFLSGLGGILVCVC